MRKILLVLLCVAVTLPLFAQGKKPVRHGSKADYDTVLAGGYNVRDSLLRLRGDVSRMLDTTKALWNAINSNQQVLQSSIAATDAKIATSIRDSSAKLRSRDTALVNPVARAAQRSQDSALAVRGSLAQETAARKINELTVTDQLDNLFTESTVQNDSLGAHKDGIAALSSSSQALSQSVQIVASRVNAMETFSWANVHDTLGILRLRIDDLYTRIGVVYDSLNVPETQKHVTVAASGSGDGSLNNPWTLAEAASAAMAGDTVNIHAGVYTSAIVPANSGSVSRPIVFRNYPADVCSLYVNGTCVSIQHPYVIVQGLGMRITSGANAPVVEIVDCDHSALLHNRIYGGTTGNTTYQGIWQTVNLSNIRHCRFVGNLVDRLDFAITSDSYRGDGINLYGDDSRYNIIEGNEVRNVSHFAIDAPTYTHGATKNIVRFNTVHTAHGLIGNGNGAKQNLYEGNKCWSPDQVDTYRSGSMGEWSGQKNILRYNMLAHDDAVVPLWGRVEYAGEHIIQCDGTGYAYGERCWNTENTDRDNRTYNNSFTGIATYTEGDYQWKYVLGITDGGLNNDFGRNVWVNNIIAYPTNRACIYYQNHNTPFYDPNDTMRANIFWRGSQGQQLFETHTKNHEGQFFTLAQAKSTFPAWIDASNLEVSPLWVDSTSRKGNRNYTTSSASLARNAGVALTHVAGAVSNSKNVKVADALYFHFAWGASPYDRGDSVLIGTTRALLDSVDYASNTLITHDNVTVSASASIHILATWSTDAMAYIKRLYGSAPDIGPYEYANE